MDLKAADINCFLLTLGLSPAALSFIVVGCLYLALEIKPLAELPPEIEDYRKCHAIIAFSLAQSLFTLGQGK